MPRHRLVRWHGLMPRIVQLSGRTFLPGSFNLSGISVVLLLPELPRLLYLLRDTVVPELSELSGNADLSAVSELRRLSELCAVSDVSRRAVVRRIRHLSGHCDMCRCCVLPEHTAVESVCGWILG